MNAPKWDADELQFTDEDGDKLFIRVGDSDAALIRGIDARNGEYTTVLIPGEFRDQVADVIALTPRTPVEPKPSLPTKSGSAIVVGPDNNPYVRGPEHWHHGDEELADWEVELLGWTEAKIVPVEKD